MALAYILSSSDEEDFIVNRRPRRLRRPRKVKRRTSYFEELDDVDFHIRFRLSKASVNTILREIEQEIYQGEL